MKKIGYIDHYLNNFHADVYVKLIREGRFKEQFDVAYAYGEVAADGVDSEQWCKDNSVELLGSPAEVVEKSDCVVVLSPNNPERHWDLCQEALASGKPVYVDKTFAPDAATAAKLVEMAVKSGTPMFTTSALRFVPEIGEFLNGIGREHPAQAVSVQGPEFVRGLWRPRDRAARHAAGAGSTAGDVLRRWAVHAVRRELRGRAHRRLQPLRARLRDGRSLVRAAL